MNNNFSTVTLSLGKSKGVCHTHVYVFVDGIELKGVECIEPVTEFLGDGTCRLKLDIRCNLKMLDSDGKEIEICRN